MTALSYCAASKPVFPTPSLNRNNAFDFDVASKNLRS